MSVNAKLSVDVSTFKKNVSDAKTSVGELKEQIGQLVAEFQAADSAADPLNKSLETQKKRLGEIESAMSKLSKEGSNPLSRSMNTLKTKMGDALPGANELKEAFGELSKKSGEAKSNTSRLAQSVEGIGKTQKLNTVVDAVSKISSGFERALRSGKKLLDQMTGAGNWADELQTKAKSYGISTDELQRMEKTAEIIDTDADTILKARQRLSRNIGKGTKQTTDVMASLGLTYEGDMEKAFWQAGEAIMALTDEAEQEAAATKLFGASWKDLVPLFDAGQKKYEEVMASWKTVSDEQIQKLSEMDDAFKTLQANLETMKMQLMSNLAEPLKWIMENEGATVAAIGAIGGALGLMKVSDTVLTFVKLAAGLKGLTGGGDTNTPGGKGTTGTGGTNIVGGGFWSRFAATALPIGLTGATMMMPAMLAKMVSDWVPDTAKLGKAARVEGAAYSEEELARLREWVELQNQLTEIESKYGTKEFDENQYNQTTDQIAALGSVQSGDLWNKFWDYLVANNITPGSGMMLPTDMLDRMAGGMVGNMPWKSAGTGTGGEGITNDSLNRFNNLPGRIESAVGKGVSGIKVQLDGSTVGRLVAPYVSEYIASYIQ